uniref:Uncharacterized protein n=1 Tax=Corvus moneduloides TaxID=1196302 RepID=A0A8U7NUL9_CORMO
GRGRAAPQAEADGHGEGLGGCGTGLGRGGGRASDPRGRGGERGAAGPCLGAGSGDPPRRMAEGWSECPALGPGWQRREAFRKSGATSGRSDTYYRSPTGQKFRSKIELRRFLGPGHDLSNFDFKSGLRRPGPSRVRGLEPGRGPKNLGRGPKNPRRAWGVGVGRGSCSSPGVRRGHP